MLDQLLLGEREKLLSYTELFFRSGQGSKSVTAKYKIGAIVQHK